MSEKQAIRNSILNSINFHKAYIAAYEEGLVDDIETYYWAKDEILRLELDLENL